MTIIGLVSAGLGVSVLPASFQRMRIEGWFIAHCWMTGRCRRCGWCSASMVGRRWHGHLPSCSQGRWLAGAV